MFTQQFNAKYAGTDTSDPDVLRAIGLAMLSGSLAPEQITKWVQSDKAMLWTRRYMSAPKQNLVVYLGA